MGFITIQRLNMYETQSLHTSLALETIINIVNNNDLTRLKSEQVPEELNVHLACFVSIHKKDGSLRGCIGTIYPQKDNLYNEIISNAVSAATKDTRFKPIKPSELEQIEISVDVLSTPQLINNPDELDPKQFGVIVSDGGLSRGVLLPDIDGIDTVEKQLSIAKRKAGLANTDNHLLKIYSFTSTRYY